MDSDWREVSRISLPSAVLHGPPCPASALSFDINQELLWVGNEYGRVTSFYGPELQKYTSYKAHDEGYVRSFLFNDRGVISLGPKSVHMSARRGLAKWHITDIEKFHELRCMSYTSRGTSEIVVGGIQKKMFTVNVDRGSIVSEYPTDDDLVVMRRRERVICCGTTQGNVNFLDPNSFKVIKTIKAHAASISDIDAQNNTLLTCGYSPRATAFVLDPLVNVYDLRTYRPLPPIPFPAGAAFCRMHPKMSTTGIVASQSGQFHVTDIANTHVVNLRQANLTSYLSALELSPTGDCLAISEADGTLQIWGSPEKMKFTEFNNPVEWPGVTRPHPPIDISTDSTPYNSVGMPYYREQLLSAWPSTMTFDVGKPPVKIDPDILSKMKMADYVGFTPNPRRTRRYQVEASKPVERSNNIQVPKFRSEKAKAGIEDLEAPSPWTVDHEGLRPFDVPAMYQKVEIKYSRFGVEDFDFEFYNKTDYSGLETHITNSYSNALLQLYKFSPIIRNLAMQHTASACLTEGCLLCELGFLFDMLDKANGQNCQATNFLKTFSLNQQAAALGLFEDGTSRGNQTLSTMIQSFNRFLLERVSAEYKSMAGGSPDLENALVTNSSTNIRCVCGNETVRPSNSLVNELSYPKLGSKQTINFSTLLKHSFDRDGQTRGWCDKCRRYQNLATRRSVERPPDIMMLNAAATSAEAKEYWGERDFLPAEIGILVQDGQFSCYQGNEIQPLIDRGLDIIVYELVALVAEIQGEHEIETHLVSLVDVSKSSGGQEEDMNWHLFNDFLVRTVSREDAMNFAPLWKLPSVLCYQTKSTRNVIDNSWKKRLDTSLLFRDLSITTKGDKYKLLSQDETPSPGTIVAIDAEFVAMQMEEMEVKADGSRETIRPSRLSLARVSVLRGSGPDDSVPLIDDYIVTYEPVVDYLTAFSGIEPGDLDLQLSKRPLVPLKLAYKRLWLLLNLGCVFVGHGLLKDFRTINIHVPKKQVIDTVDIFFLKARQRKLSLRFLAWYLLHETIQTGNHDSIEDARTALLLYRKYLEFEDAGIFETMLQKIYSDGKLTNFKPPGENEANISGVGGSTGLFAGSNTAGAGSAGQTSPPQQHQQHLARTMTPPVLKDGSGNGTVFGNQISSPVPRKRQWP